MIKTIDILKSEVFNLFIKYGKINKLNSTRLDNWLTDYLNNNDIKGSLSYKFLNVNYVAKNGDTLIKIMIDN